ncbi:hypothetical protein CXB51_027719 [Gossypium anomalum]|uniref:Uncharacterized protein n=1 Tax=Gossypium anomalum TaxID=47600 RepID=A0A8J5YB70_9ROSI|nr:hypothetical protein CXB51_027719 [Gossypium anomalum]
MGPGGPGGGPGGPGGPGGWGGGPGGWGPGPGGPGGFGPGVLVGVRDLEVLVGVRDLAVPGALDWRPWFLAWWVLWRLCRWFVQYDIFLVSNQIFTQFRCTSTVFAVVGYYKTALVDALVMVLPLSSHLLAAVATCVFCSAR